MESTRDTDQVWVTCTNCHQSYQVDRTQYYAELEEKSKASPSAKPMTLPIKCQRCGQETLMVAHKCDQCGEVFRPFSIPNDFADRCPACKYSTVEAMRKARFTQQSDRNSTSGSE